MIIGMINIIKEYLFVGLAIIGVLCLLYFFVYYIIYKKLLRGKKHVDIKKALIVTTFVVYIFLVLVATMLSRNFEAQGGINFELFSSYKKAISYYSIFLWRDISLNIIMFIPLGLLLPLINKIFYKPYFTLLLSFCFTLSIEITQLVTKIGTFDLDDIFNNFIGAIIGYCIIMLVLSITSHNKHKIRNTILYIIPLALVAIIFFTIFISYKFKSNY